jgi:uncharacterized membrane protein YkvI
MEGLIHLTKQKEAGVFHILTYLIPIMLFILLVVVILSKTNTNNQQAAVTQDNQAVLGNETDNLK